MTIHNVQQLQHQFPSALKSETIRLLLELVRPLDANRVLAKLDNGTMVELELKTALEMGQKYMATLKDEAGKLVVQRATLLPPHIQTILAKPATIALPLLIEHLTQHLSPEKLLVQTLSNELLEHKEPLLVREKLEQIAQAVLAEQTLFVFEHDYEKGYVATKKPKSSFSKKVLEFDAFFPRLGFMQGKVALVEDRTTVTILVEDTFAKAILESHKNALGMDVRIEVVKESLQPIADRVFDIKV